MIVKIILITRLLFNESECIKLMKTYKVWLLSSLTILFWATAFPISKIVVASLDPLYGAELRLTVAAITLGIIGLFQKVRFPGNKKDIGLFILAGLTGNFLYQMFFITALGTISSGTSSVINALIPVITAVMSAVFFKERLSTSGWIYIFTAFIGVAILVLWEGIFSIKVGVFWMLLCTIAFSIYNLSSRYLAQAGYDAFSLVLWGMVISAICGSFLLPGAIAAVIDLPINISLLVIYLGVFSSAIGYMLWGTALKQAEKASDVVNFMFVTPALSTLLGFFWLHEVPNFGFYIGGTIIIGSVILFSKYR